MPQEFLPYSKPEDDGRVKITKDMYPLVRETYRELNSYQKTADHFGVSKRLIIFIVKPETLKTLQDRDKQNEHWKRYYNKDKHREYMRRYRAKKRKHGLRVAKGKPRKYLNQ